MVNLHNGRLLSLLIKYGRAAVETAITTESAIETTTEVNAQADPMPAYWETDKINFNKKKQPFIDSFLKDVALDRIPDATEKPVVESRYDFDRLSQIFSPELKNLNIEFAGVTEGVPKGTTGISSSGRDAGVVAGIVVAVISGVIILAAVIAGFMYRHYVHRNVTSMNFDNPVYRKTTEDQFALEKNGYAPGSKLYPSTVGEEAQEPLNNPGTNEFV